MCGFTSMPPGVVLLFSSLGFGRRYEALNELTQ
jgi:hypothetical protein